MTRDELLDIVDQIQKTKCETRTLEIKAAHTGCPKRLYDTLSSFSNQDDGGILIFGVDEVNDFAECGVYDPQDLQRQINDQCRQMEPVVRPLLTVAEKNGLFFVSAEVAGLDISERPCYYQGRGRLKGSYVRVGDSDEPMTEYEIYSYEAFRKKYQDDIRAVPSAPLDALNQVALDSYVKRLKAEKPNLSALPDEDVYRLMSVVRDGAPCLSAVLLFCLYPQAYFPQLAITAIALPGQEMGEVGAAGERFLDNRRIEGSLPEMLNGALAFVIKNMRRKTVINPDTGKREDRTEYPVTAVREAIVNALVHRDYSEHTQGMPIRLMMFPDRLEIHNPGGIYGRLRVDQLGKVQSDTRNPVLATAMEVLGLTENRYSGIPTIRRVMRENGLAEPVFADDRGTFSVTFYNAQRNDSAETNRKERKTSKRDELLEFLRTPRSRQDIADYLGVKTIAYAMKSVDPLIEQGLVVRTLPDVPRSKRQMFLRSDQVN